MADVELKFDMKKARKMFDDIMQGSNNITKLQDAYVGSIAAPIYKDVISHFEKEAGPKGKWKKWSDVYTEHMRKIGKSGNKILQDSGRLRQSFTPEKYKTSKDKLIFYNPAKTKTGFPYAAAHDEGGPKLPQRKFMWLSAKTSDLVNKLTLEYLIARK